MSLAHGEGKFVPRDAEMLKALHSGIVTDYVAWLTAGVAALGAAFVFALR